ncbi:hypothetical protein LXL04_036933 [Taraxacum kok-saghyz]
MSDYEDSKEESVIEKVHDHKSSSSSSSSISIDHRRLKLLETTRIPIAFESPLLPPSLMKPTAAGADDEPYTDVFVQADRF